MGKLGSFGDALKKDSAEMALLQVTKSRPASKIEDAPPAQQKPVDEVSETTGKHQPKVRQETKPEPEPAEPVADEAPPGQHRPHYSKLVRKELRVFQDQSLELAHLTGTIRNAKFGKGEVISDNSLIRIGIDLLLERQSDLQGTTEDELRASLGLPPRY